MSGTISMSTARPKGRTEVRISPVCNKCRDRHLKCDGGPQCSRCWQEGAICQFRPSRRGMRRSSQRDSTVTLDDGLSYAALADQILTQSKPPIVVSTGHSTLSALPRDCTRSQSDSASHLLIAGDTSIYLTDLFYTNFAPEYPFVLPREHFVRELAAVDQCPLKPVIEYIGTFYDTTFDREGYQNRAGKLLATSMYPSDGSLVQALLIFAIGLRTSGYLTKADIFLRKANNCATTIGMDDRAFSCLGPGGQIIQVESWRRTWSALQDLGHLWRSSPHASTTMRTFPRCAIAETTAQLGSMGQPDSSSLLTVSTTGEKSAASLFAAAGTLLRPSSDTSQRQDRSHREDGDTCILDQLLESQIHDSMPS